MSVYEFQNQLIDITTETLDRTISLFRQCQFSKLEIASLLFEYVTIHPENAELYASFYCSIIPENNKNNEQFNTILNFVIIQNIINSVLTSEKVFLLFLLYIKGIIPIQFINQIFSSIHESYLPLFLIFLPEFYEDENMRETIVRVAESSFIDIDHYSRGNFEKFKFLRLTGQNPDPILTQIRLKNSQQIDDYNAIVPFSLFERASFLSGATFGEYVIYFQHPSFSMLTITKENIERYCKAAILGNNIAFLKKNLFDVLIYDDLLEKTRNRLLLEWKYQNSPWIIDDTPVLLDDSNDIGRRYYSLSISDDPNYHVSTVDEMNGRVYANKECCLQSLNNWAYRQGFKFVKNQSTSASVLQIRCHLGSKQQSISLNDTKDSTTCNFRASICERKDLSCKVRINDPHREHLNHQLNKFETQHFLLPSEIIETVKVLRKGLAKPKIIANYIKEITGIQLRGKIDEISNMKTDNINEAQDLFDYTVCVNGKAEVIREDRKIVGITTFTKNELNNIEKFGEVISIEEITIPNKNNWTAYQLYGINNNFEIISFGSFYLLNKSFNSMNNILESVFGMIKSIRKITTVIIELNMVDNIKSILASLHQLGNIEHFIISADSIKWHIQQNLFLIENDSKEAVMKNIEQFLTTTSLTLFNSAWTALTNISQEFADFIKQSLFDYNGESNTFQYARCYLGDITTYGLNYVSLKSKFKMLIFRNYPNKLISLLDCKKSFDFDSKKKYILTLRATAFDLANNLTAPMNELASTVPDNVAHLLSILNYRSFRYEANLNETKDLIMITDHDDEQTYSCTIKSDDFTNTNDVTLSCLCNCANHIGLPCSHLFKAYSVLNEWPEFGGLPKYPWKYISSHFFIQRNENNIWNTIWNNQVRRPLISDPQSYSNTHIDANELFAGDSLIDDSHRKRFSQMMEIANETAKICVYSQEDTNGFIDALQKYVEDKIKKISGVIPDPPNPPNDENH